MNQPRVQWGIMGTGGIATRFATQLPQSKTGVLRAVGSRSIESAEKFGAQHKIEARYGSYQAMLDDPAVQAVYISLPNHLHAEWTIRAAQAGKHILCEKPFALNHAEAMTAIEAVRRNGVFLMEAFMYRCHPVMEDVMRRLRAGEIGPVRYIDARFAYTGAPNPQNCRWKNAEGGGGIMDLGCYCVSMVRLLAGAALGLDGAAEPKQLKGFGHMGDYNVDEWATATLRFENDILANVYASQRVGTEHWVRVYGDKGRITLGNPWFPGRNGEPAVYTLALDSKDPQEISIPTPGPLYANEADVVAAHLAARQAPSPCMTWADTCGNMETLDAWRQEVGLVFESEKPETMRPPFPSASPVGRERPASAPGEGPPSSVVRGSPDPAQSADRRSPAAPLIAPGDHTMQYGRVAGLDKPVSRLVLGTMGYIFRDLPHACAMADHFFEQGGNAFDTAYLYGGGTGRQERMLGQWIRSRGVRDQVIILGKGASLPNCNPKAVREQLIISLERFGFDYVDVYIMHRDNLEIPVGEFVDVLNELRHEGCLRAFGGSNWTTQRIDEANAYAQKNGKTGFTASSPNFSLAVWNVDPWGQCVTAVDPDSRRWYAQNQMALFAWSSQASGMLTGRFKPEDSSKPENKDTARIWFSDANFERLNRVTQLAKQKNVARAQIALAYVLRQPLNIFALIGPHTINEMNEALASTPVALTADELRWLNLEA